MADGFPEDDTSDEERDHAHPQFISEPRGGKKEKYKILRTNSSRYLSQDKIRFIRTAIDIITD